VPTNSKRPHFECLTCLAPRQTSTPPNRSDDSRDAVALRFPPRDRPRASRSCMREPRRNHRHGPTPRQTLKGIWYALEDPVPRRTATPAGNRDAWQGDISGAWDRCDTGDSARCRVNSRWRSPHRRATGNVPTRLPVQRENAHDSPRSSGASLRASDRRESCYHRRDCPAAAWIESGVGHPVRGPVAQWQSTGLITPGSQVRILPGPPGRLDAHEIARSVVALQPGFTLVYFAWIGGVRSCCTYIPAHRRVRSSSRLSATVPARKLHRRRHRHLAES
jgi:hypothetical protein